jgi:hypothetical protein
LTPGLEHFSRVEAEVVKDAEETGSCARGRGVCIVRVEVRIHRQPFESTIMAGRGGWRVASGGGYR